MELFENTQAFNDAIVATSNYYHLSPSFVEKDYFVTYILKNLNERIPGLLFRGGTSLSKCFKVIKRFSEDIDLTLDVSHYTQSNKRNANKTIIKTCDEIGFEILNRNYVECHSHGNYNCYLINYPISFSENIVKPTIKVEMTFIQKTYPDIIKPVSSLITDYLISINQSSLLTLYGLDSFLIKVQSSERTFVDKVFALCDYYLLNHPLRQSRHIYDLYKLINIVDWRSLKSLIKDVRLDRAHNKDCVSAKATISIPLTLKEIIGSNYYLNDYNSVTISLLNEKISYEEAITSLIRIAQSSIFE